jgi:hypothetical protein
MKGCKAVPAKLPLCVTAIDGSLSSTSTIMENIKWREYSTRILGPGKNSIKQNLCKLDYSNLLKIQVIEIKKVLLFLSTNP